MSGVRCTNKRLRSAFVLFLVCVIFMTGCGLSYDFGYDPDSSVTSFKLNDSADDGRADSFASDLCVADGDVNKDKLSLGKNEAETRTFSTDSRRKLDGCAVAFGYILYVNSVV